MPLNQHTVPGATSSAESLHVPVLVPPELGAIASEIEAICQDSLRIIDILCAATEENKHVANGHVATTILLDASTAENARTEARHQAAAGASEDQYKQLLLGHERLCQENEYLKQQVRGIVRLDELFATIEEKLRLERERADALYDALRETSHKLTAATELLDSSNRARAQLVADVSRLTALQVEAKLAHAGTIATMKAKNALSLATHSATIATLKTERDAAFSTLAGQHEAVVVATRAHLADLADTKQRHADAISAARTAHDATKQELFVSRAGHATTRRELAAAATEHATAIATMKSEHAAALAAAESSPCHDMAAELDEATDACRVAHTKLLAIDVDLANANKEIAALQLRITELTPRQDAPRSPTEAALYAVCNHARVGLDWLSVAAALAEDEGALWCQLPPESVHWNMMEQCTAWEYAHSSLSWLRASIFLRLVDLAAPRYPLLAPIAGGQVDIQAVFRYDLWAALKTLPGLQAIPQAAAYYLCDLVTVPTDHSDSTKWRVHAPPVHDAAPGVEWMRGTIASNRDEYLRLIWIAMFHAAGVVFNGLSPHAVYATEPDWTPMPVPEFVGYVGLQGVYLAYPMGCDAPGPLHDLLLSSIAHHALFDWNETDEFEFSIRSVLGTGPLDEINGKWKLQCTQLFDEMVRECGMDRARGRAPNAIVALAKSLREYLLGRTYKIHSRPLEAWIMAWVLSHGTGMECAPVHSSWLKLANSLGLGAEDLPAIYATWKGTRDRFGDYMLYRRGIIPPIDAGGEVRFRDHEQAIKAAELAVIQHDRDTTAYLQGRCAKRNRQANQEGQ